MSTILMLAEIGGNLYSQTALNHNPERPEPDRKNQKPFHADKIWHIRIKADQAIFWIQVFRFLVLPFIIIDLCLNQIFIKIVSEVIRVKQFVMYVKPNYRSLHSRIKLTMSSALIPI